MASEQIDKVLSLIRATPRVLTCEDGRQLRVKKWEATFKNNDIACVTIEAVFINLEVGE